MQLGCSAALQAEAGLTTAVSRFGCSRSGRFDRLWTGPNLAALARLVAIGVIQLGLEKSLQCFFD
jgi:hypothetical protein